MYVYYKQGVDYMLSLHVEWYALNTGHIPPTPTTTY